MGGKEDIYLFTRAEITVGLVEDSPKFWCCGGEQKGCVRGGGLGCVVVVVCGNGSLAVVCGETVVLVSGDKVLWCGEAV